jgi:hypothetical protein
MPYERVKHLKPAEFKRFWGVTHETFDQMLEKTLYNFNLLVEDIWVVI